jgi:hypothetical protein
LETEYFLIQISVQKKKNPAEAGLVFFQGIPVVYKLRGFGQGDKLAAFRAEEYHEADSTFDDLDAFVGGVWDEGFLVTHYT